MSQTKREKATRVLFQNGRAPVLLNNLTDDQLTKLAKIDDIEGPERRLAYNRWWNALREGFELGKATVEGSETEE